MNIYSVLDDSDDEVPVTTKVETKPKEQKPKGNAKPTDTTKPKVEKKDADAKPKGRR